MAEMMKDCEKAQLPQNQTNKDIMTRKFDPNSKEIMKQEQNLKCFEQHEQKRNRFDNYVQVLLEKKPAETLMHDSDNFRAKQEAKELCDLGCTVEEKYGPYTSWKLSLRQNWDDKTKSKKKQQITTIIDEDNEAETPNILDYRN